MLSQPESSLPCPRKDAIFGRREVRNWHKSKHCFTSLMACLSTFSKRNYRGAPS